MKLYVVTLSIGKNETPLVKTYTGRIGTSIIHYSGEGFDVKKETANCWYLNDLPYGLPERYRKADEYTLISNNKCVYMFGQDESILIEKWNQCTAA